jgi:uncharacterized protein YxjI
MKLYIKQRIFTFRDKFDVKDENKNVVFQVKSDFFSIPPTIRLFHAQGEELFVIKRKLISLLAKFRVYSKNEEVATISQKWSFMKKVFEVECKYGKLDLIGNIFALNFQLMLEGKLVASIQKALISFGDSYEIIIEEGYDPGLLTCIVIAIDHALHNESRRG